MLAVFMRKTRRVARSMSVAVETTVSSVPLPLPTHFSHAEQSFALKKRRPALSSLATPSCPSPARLSNSLPPLPPSKGYPGQSRMLHIHQSPWTPLSNSLTSSPPPSSVYDPSKQLSYFDQCFTDLGLLGRGSFGEVHKVQSNEDRRQYAVKRSAHRFRGNAERNLSLREARSHERLCPHPHILDFVAAWEERGRLYIQTELCRTSLQLHAEKQPPGPDEPAAWGYLCDLLSALQHLHSHGYVHLDLKPANVLITDSGRLKLGDFGLLLRLKQRGSEEEEEEKEKEKEKDAQEGDPRYMAPELLRGEYGPAADVFSLGVSILELACNIDVPNGGKGWQQLRQGHLPAEVTSGLSSELLAVLKMMLTPDPSKRATVAELLALPSVRKRRWKRRLYLSLAETTLMLASLCQLVVSFGWRLLSPFHLSLPWWSKPLPCTPPKENSDRDLMLSLSAMQTDQESPEDDALFGHPSDPELSPALFHRVRSRLSLDATSTPISGVPLHNRHSPGRTPTLPGGPDWSSFKLPGTPSSPHSNGSFFTPTLNSSPALAELPPGSARSLRSPSASQRRGRNWLQMETAAPRRGFEPKNLLSLFEDTSMEAQP